MSDLYYIEEGYLEPKYYVYIALGNVAMGPYIDEGYIEANYYEDYSAAGSLVCDAEIVTGVVVEATGTWTSNFTQTATVGKLFDVTVSVDALFTPSLVADALKNHSAILESQFNLNADAVVNRSTNVLLEHIANLNAQAAKTAVTSATVSSLATQTTNGTKTASTSSNLSTTATVSSDVLKLKLASSTLSVISNAIARGYKPFERPLTITTQSSVVIDNTTFRLGTGALRANRNGVLEYTSNNFATTTITGRFWTRWNANATDTVNLFYINNNTVPARTVIAIQKTADDKITVQWNRNDLTTQTFTTTGTYADDTWHHIAFNYNVSSATIQVFVNGTTILNRTEPSLFIGTAQKRLGMNGSGQTSSQVWWDEVEIANNGSTAQHTQELVNTSNNILLAHYNTNFLDDSSLVQQAQANLNSQSVLSAQANASVKQGAALAESLGTLTANITILKVAESNQSSAFSTNIDATRIKPLESAVSSESSVSAIVGVVKPFVISVGSLFAPLVTVNAQKAGVALLEALSQLTSTAVKTTDVFSAVDVISAQTASAEKTTDSTADISALSQVTADNIRIRFGVADLNSEFAQIADNDKIKQTEVNISSVVSLAVDIDKLRQFASTLTATATADIIAAKTTDSTADFNLTASQVETSTRVRFGQSTIDAVITQTASAIKTTRPLVEYVCEFAQSTDAHKTTDSIIDSLSLFEPNVQAVARLAGVADLDPRFTASITVTRIKPFIPNTNTGVAGYQNGIPKVGPLVINRPPFNQLNVNTVGFTASIWVRRRTVGNVYQVIWAPGNSVGIQTALIYDNNDIRLRNTFDPDEPGATWQNRAPMDTNWHHILLQCSSSGVGDPFGPGRYWKLWLDGVYQGEDSYFATQSANSFNNGDYLFLNSGTTPNIYDEIFPNGVQNKELDYAQIWVGLLPTTSLNQTRTATVNPYLFYRDGYLDLGPTGRGAFDQLPQPDIYATLDDPWQGVVFTEEDYDTLPKSSSQPIGIPYQINSQLICQPVQRVVSAGSFSSTATATVQGNYRVDQSAAISSVSTLTVAITQFTGVISNQSVTVTVTVTGSKFTGFDSDLISTATVSALPGFFDTLSADISAAAILDCDFEVRPPIRTEAFLTATTSISADIDVRTEFAALVMSLGTLTADITVIPPVRVEADLVSEFQLTSIVGSIEQFAILTVSSGTMSVNAVKTATISQALNSSLSQTANATKFTGIIETFTAFNTQLTVGDVINIDPSLQLKIKPESRGLFILKETRFITIDSETRVNIIKE